MVSSRLERSLRPTNPETQDSLSVAHGADLFFTSYYFSQGLPGLQLNIFRYLHLIRPAWRIADEEKPVIRRQALAKVFQHLQHAQGEQPPGGKVTHASYRETDIYSDVSGNLDEMKNILDGAEDNNPDFQQKDYVISQLAYWVYTRDFETLFEEKENEKKEVIGVSEKGRPRHGINPNAPYGFGDPWLSHAIYYGVLGNPTPMGEFDEMFRDIGEYIKSGKLFQDLDRVDDVRFATVDELYWRKHPQQPTEHVVYRSMSTNR